jgi:hypothetical protein
MEGQWRKSSYSDGGEANCVEVQMAGVRLWVRDSKAPDNGVLAFSLAGQTAWLSAVKDGLLDR